MAREALTLTELARVGFAELGEVRACLDEVVTRGGPDSAELLPLLARTASPDAALSGLIALLRQAPAELLALLACPGAPLRLLLVLGASRGLTDFFLRHPEELGVLATRSRSLPGPEELTRDLLASVGAVDGFAALVDDAGWVALRVRYRRRLAEVAAFDLEQADPVAGLDGVARALSDLAAAALEGSLAVARTMVAAPVAAPGVFPVDQVRSTRLAVIGMGKAGARELNYVSDVDVIFVAEADPETGLESGRAVDIATRLAILLMRGLNQPTLEPELWEVDPNLRPEGKSGALVRSLDSHIAYYERWAKSWEFQALLKARPLAGHAGLGERYLAAVGPKVWTSASRENFVESVQRMRERVTDNIPDDEVDVQLKLGPGGLRDIEFTVQLLQLVHGQADEDVRQAGTLPALAALAESGYVGRAEAAEFSQDYRILRLMEHRLQLYRLRRTHLVPRDEASLRILARATGLASGAAQLSTRWADTKHRVRGLHERLFYRPLLSAVAALPDGELVLTSAQAEARLAAIGFRDTKGAFAHIAALTGGVSRRATIQRHLLPVLLQWFSEGADPDYGLLAFRRLSDSLGSTYWFLRMLRDSSGAAERLTRVLSSSRFVGELLETIPESVAWLENENDLRPRPLAVLRAESRAVLARHQTPEAAASVLRTARRREILRLAFSSILGRISIDQLATGLTDVTATVIEGVTAAIRGTGLRGEPDGDADGIEFAVIGMGRFGGAELGFGSDADVMYVFRAGKLTGEAAHARAMFIARELKRLTEDSRLPLDLDLGLRPEGKNGPVARSLDSYEAYYRRWSLTWEAQALLRGRGVAGDARLLADFETLADSVRFPLAIDDQAVREIKRMKARVEKERLPQGADPNRHLKLGRGSLSDVEWFVQLLQLQHAAAIPELRTHSTLGALQAAARAGLVSDSDAETLRAAWIFASRCRSAMTLWMNRTADTLPTDRIQLEGIARILEYPPGSANRLEDDYLAVTRRARAVFERRFYGPVEHAGPFAG
ncbi:MULTISPECIES: bifunctional [glutamine synthetase] adenylyltransferase/[glutamine synthetase]-adenylyl-L-tyrosine phosphorylase [unclassified Cryobacterium]|uniref:bifunctional [glutamine synthetase] adenylyltransferase/[glutamine synthetase]-adenylyl-L-tyrosine phosphorylase n=1 Tax=unclassified Cryobacterium TaxID=2649013 RepID=UPI00106CD92B|nr:MULTISPECIES: bifunctional [glutamine synthetase] adenylyltransferase/[glutamine synthetase]-adenylyl-L-tyrosine phosphorylase [unclassified Cryobacterium]TFC00251.1 bifunctional [glutamine synthetase] adenylyltransferase/[glutamine synthetase]-adenylyl-L-tyrosine phosphorylase [Cryobacterium sp. MDB2-A-1]TFC10235.1 bifunctional [glutamine synthetase] adenylyltransferase/[glutamine synthetase]-adenylyl-L-tyrosine phosphorylase [Cryobacterium sp. MDB2-33-2]TFC13318.1 bifunctional [glutamine sy